MFSGSADRDFMVNTYFLTEHMRYKKDWADNIQLRKDKLPQMEISSSVRGGYNNNKSSRKNPL